jgi:hypothetical protein
MLRDFLADWTNGQLIPIAFYQVADAITLATFGILRGAGLAVSIICTQSRGYAKLSFCSNLLLEQISSVSTPCVQAANQADRFASILADGTSHRYRTGLQGWSRSGWPVQRDGHLIDHTCCHYKHICQEVGRISLLTRQILSCHKFCRIDWKKSCMKAKEQSEATEAFLESRRISQMPHD